jgi:hypothetical protein
MEKQKISNKSKVNPAWLTLIVLSLFAPVWAQEEGPTVLDEIVAKVNFEIITLTDLKQTLADRRFELTQGSNDLAQTEKKFQAEKPGLLKTMIQNKLMLQKASEFGLDSGVEPDVVTYLEDWRKETGVPSLEILDQYLQQRGSSLQRFKEKIKSNLITQAVYENLIYPKITLLTAEVEAYYEDNEAEFAVPAKVELGEILFLIEGKDRREVQAKAEQVLARLQKGDSFEELAKEFSEGPTASKGGQIGSFNRGTMNPALEDVAFTLEVGEISGIIESDFGFQIIKVLDRSEATLKPLSEVRPRITQILYQKKAVPEIERFLKQLIQDSYIYVSPKYAEEYDLEGLI